MKSKLENSLVFACNGDVAVLLFKIALVLLNFLDQAIRNHIVDALFNSGRVLSEYEFVIGELQLAETILQLLFIYSIRPFDLFAIH